jgi:hypothetical protein
MGLFRCSEEPAFSVFRVTDFSIHLEIITVTQQRTGMFTTLIERHRLYCAVCNTQYICINFTFILVIFYITGQFLTF